MERTGSTRCLARAALSLTLAAVVAIALLGNPGRGAAGYAYLASQTEPTVFVLDTATAAYVARTEQSVRPESYATVDPSGSWVGVASTGLTYPAGHFPPFTWPSFRVLDASTHLFSENVRLIDAYPYLGGGLVFHPARPIAYVGMEGVAAIVDLASMTTIGSTDGFLTHGVAMAIHPAGTFLYVTGHYYGDDRLTVLDTITKKAVTTLAVAGGGPLAVRPDGAFVYVVSEPLGSLSVVRTSDHTVVGSVALPCAPSAVAAAPDSARLYVAHRGCPFLSVVDTATGQVGGSIPLPIAADGVDVDPTGTTIVAVHSGGSGDTAFVTFVDAERATAVRTVGLPSPVFSPLGRFVGPALPPERRPPLNEGPLPAAPTTPSRLVRTLYDSVLGRPAADGEVEAWLEFLDSRGSAAGLPALMNGVFASEEMLTLAVTPAILARLLYRGVLGREPDAAGLAALSAVLAEHLAAIVPGFVGSLEFQQTGAALPPSVLVARLYQEILERAAAAAESAGWVDYLARTGDAGSVVRAFVLSDEYLARPRSPVEHVTGLYRALLGRDPDPPSLAAWGGFIAAQRAAVVGIFLGSPEFAARLAAITE
jgi:DNA-binding beta-propeller fold protein YncE